MTRAELAELVNAQVFRASGGERVTCVEANHVGKWERGVIRWPTAPYRAALRVILEVGTDGELGLVRPRRGAESDDGDDVNRKHFLKTALGVGASMVTPGAAFAHDGEPELRSALSGPTAHYRRMEHALSSRQLAPAVEAHLALARSVVSDRLPTSAGYAVLSETAGLAAWLAVDCGDQGGARRRYVEAVRHAQRAHQPLLVPYMTGSLGQFAVDAGDPRQGMDLLRRARRQLGDAAPDSARAWLASLHAVAYAELADRKGSHLALRTAERLAGRQRGEPVWPWVFTFDRAKAAQYQATTLARLGDLRGATTAYRDCASTVTSPKARALMKLDHAGLLARTPGVGDGCALAVDALRVGRAYGSERITARVRTFRAGLPSSTREARTLDDELAALYEAQTP